MAIYLTGTIQVWIDQGSINRQYVYVYEHNFCFISHRESYALLLESLRISRE